jgi:hypothetical protein
MPSQFHSLLKEISYLQGWISPYGWNLCKVRIVHGALQTMLATILELNYKHLYITTKSKVCENEVTPIKDPFSSWTFHVFNAREHRVSETTFYSPDQSSTCYYNNIYIVVINCMTVFNLRSISYFSNSSLHDHCDKLVAPSRGWCHYLHDKF